MLLQTPASQIFALLPVIIAFGLLWIIAKSALSATSGGSVSGAARRGFLSHIVEIVTVGILIAFVAPTTLEVLSEESDALQRLIIRSGQTTTVSTSSETYTAVYWEDTGTLEWPDGGTFTLADQT